jgi:hypothetical protein
MLRIVRYTLLLLAIAFLAIVSFGPGVPAPASGMTGVEPGLRGPDAAAVIFPGDVNCSGATDGIDSLQIFRTATPLLVDDPTMFLPGVHA